MTVIYFILMFEEREREKVREGEKESGEDSTSVRSEDNGTCSPNRPVVPQSGTVVPPPTVRNQKGH